MYDWNDRAALCGNCRHWPLGGYQHDWEGCAPSGNAGSDSSDCRRRAPLKGQWGPEWPRTRMGDSCGEFELRPETHRRLRQSTAA